MLFLIWLTESSAELFRRSSWRRPMTGGGLLSRLFLRLLLLVEEDELLDIPFSFTGSGLADAFADPASEFPHQY